MMRIVSRSLNAMQKKPTRTQPCASISRFNFRRAFMMRLRSGQATAVVRGKKPSSAEEGKCRVDAPKKRTLPYLRAYFSSSFNFLTSCCCFSNFSRAACSAALAPGSVVWRSEVAVSRGARRGGGHSAAHARVSCLS